MRWRICRRRSGDCRFKAALREDADGYAYEFAPAAGQGPSIVVAWLPTGDGRASTRALPAAGRQLRKAERLALAPGPAAAITIKDRDGSWELPLGETPLLLWIEPLDWK